MLGDNNKKAPWYFWVALGVAFVGPTSLIILEKSEAGWVLLVSSIVVMLGSRFSAIEELSLGPLRAKMTEKVREVDHAIAEVKSLAQTLITPVVTMGMRIGRWDSGLSRREAYDLAQSTEAVLKRLEVPEDEIAESLKDFYKYTLFDMCRPI